METSDKINFFGTLLIKKSSAYFLGFAGTEYKTQNKNEIGERLLQHYNKLGAVRKLRKHFFHHF